MEYSLCVTTLLGDGSSIGTDIAGFSVLYVPCHLSNTPTVGNVGNKSLQESNIQHRTPKIQARPDNGSLRFPPPLHTSLHHYLHHSKDKEIALASGITDKNYGDEGEENANLKQIHHEVNEA